MRLIFCLTVGVILATYPASATPDKKSEIEVVSLEWRKVEGGMDISMHYTAKIVLADGSHVMASCDLDAYSRGGCALDDGYLDRLKKRLIDRDTVELTGFPKFEAKRNGAELAIYTKKGKKKYLIFDSW
jgi:hypothetical protein